MNKRIWWLNPAIIYFFLFMLVTYAFYVPEKNYIELYNMQKGINDKYLFVHFLGLNFFILGYWLSKKIKIKSICFYYLENQFIQTERLISAYKILWFICIGAYLIWYINFFMIHGLGILKYFTSIDGISSIMYVMRNNSGKLPGVTTFTEIGIPTVTLGAYLYFNIQNESRRGKILISLFTIVVVALFRSVAFSERLALIELVIPIFIVYLTEKTVFKKQYVYSIFPILLIGCLFIVFGIFEYSRSWKWFYINYYDSYIEFIIQRVMGYYTNAINTECLFLEYGGHSLLPYRSINWIWSLPGMNEIYDNWAYCNVRENTEYILVCYGNQEFNNPGGLLTFYSDFGELFLFFQLVFGFVVGKSYVYFVKSNIWGILFYMYLYFILLELPRHFLLGLSKSLCVFVGWVIIYLIVKVRIKI